MRLWPDPVLSAAGANATRCYPATTRCPVGPRRRATTRCPVGPRRAAGLSGAACFRCQAGPRCRADLRCQARPIHQTGPNRQNGPIRRSQASSHAGPSRQAGPSRHAGPGCRPTALRASAACQGADQPTAGARWPATHCLDSVPARATAPRPDASRLPVRARRPGDAHRPDRTLRTATAQPAVCPLTAQYPRAWPGPARPGRTRPGPARPGRAWPGSAWLRPRTRPAGPGSSSRACAVFLPYHCRTEGGQDGSIRPPLV